MAYLQEVKEAAYVLDPECWESYSGKPKQFKQWMEWRRMATLKVAQAEFDFNSLWDTKENHDSSFS